MVETQQFLLRGMAVNYRPGNLVDHLDIEVFRKAADEIAALSTKLAEAEQELRREKLRKDSARINRLRAEAADAEAKRLKEALTELQDDAQVVRDTFDTDIQQGYKTKDKVYAVNILSQALEAARAALAGGSDE